MPRHQIEVHEIAALDDQAAQALFDRLIVSGACGAGTRRACERDARHALEPLGVCTWCIVGGQWRGRTRHGTCPRYAWFLWRDLPELERRIAFSEYSHTEAHVRLETPLGSLGIAIEHGKPRITNGRDAALVTLPWSAFGSLDDGLSCERNPGRTAGSAHRRRPHTALATSVVSRGKPPLVCTTIFLELTFLWKKSPVQS